MLKLSAVLTIAAFTACAHAQEIPSITKVDLKALREHKTLFANQATLPLFYLGRTSGSTKFEPAEYFGGRPFEYLPADLVNVATKATPNGNEFDQRDGARAAKPWFDEMIAAAKGFEYVLLHAQGEVGTYDFDSGAFPVRITMDVPFEVRKQKYAGYCAGVLSRVPQRGKHIPCIAVAGFNKRTGTSIQLPVPDEKIARQIALPHAGDRFAYMMLVRVLDKQEIIGVSGWSHENVTHILSALPVAIYVFDTTNDKLLAKTAIAIAEPKTKK